MTRYVPLLFVLVACWGGGSGEALVIGAKNDVDTRILGEKVARHLESEGCRVERQFDLEDAKAADTALVAGRIDAYVESQRIALLEILGQSDPQTNRIETVLRPLYVNRGLFWSPPLGEGDLAVVYRRDIDRKCRAASRAMMRLAYIVDETSMKALRQSATTGETR
jgi:glycine betaine/choline ABC-type transport system substrate-binding protein